jgi:hypothetical protein
LGFEDGAIYVGQFSMVTFYGTTSWTVLRFLHNFIRAKRAKYRNARRARKARKMEKATFLRQPTLDKSKAGRSTTRRGQQINIQDIEFPFGVWRLIARWKGWRRFDLMLILAVRDIL